MGNTRYSDNKTVQIIIALLKGHGINKVVISPGTTNFMFVASIQNDDWFEIKSAADERSAAYIACGWAAETKTPVVISCTGATASRNYFPALTEAYYRKLPVLALTSINDSAMPGHNIPQVIDRSNPPNDVVKLSVNINDVRDDASMKKCIISANKAILELFRNGGGPVHINMMTKMSGEFNTTELPKPRVIRRYNKLHNLPQIDRYNKIGIYIGSHLPFSTEEIKSIEDFCECYNAVVLCEHISNYHGKYKFNSAYVASQEYLPREKFTFDLMIDIGEVAGDYYKFPVKEVWRVSSDGELRDRFGKLMNIFEMEELDFFNYYASCTDGINEGNDLYEELIDYEKDLRSKEPEVPFSNIWIAKKTAEFLPSGCVMHLGILNSLRAWNFSEIPNDINVYSNVGGFGIDGGVSTLLGASLANPEKLFLGFVGDLAFFYDMNSLGNRHVGNNIRILVVNNGKGTEFRNYSHPASVIGDSADMYVAAAGHYGNKSSRLLRHYAEDLGFIYMSASNKEEFMNNIESFTTPVIGKQPIMMEVFTDSKDESDALQTIRTIVPEAKAKALLKKSIGEKNYKLLVSKVRGN